ncbi:hypothetical protein B566_EDAN000718 [Ephemera danica]|nr:hypothetical protein B566_EDAN000718 [Ephemera danica]
MASCAAGNLQWAGAALLLLVLPMARGSAGAELDMEELMWPPGNSVAAVERAKRTGLVSEMRGGLGGMGGLSGNGLGGGGGGGMGPSLSIVNPLDVLRQRLLLEMVRRRMRQNDDQVLANRERLNSVGKRSVPSTTHAQQQADLRGLLLRRHERSARAEVGQRFLRTPTLFLHLLPSYPLTLN